MNERRAGLSPILGERAPAECLQHADPLQYTNTNTDTIHKYGYKYRHKYRYQKLSASRELNNTLHFIKHTIHSADSIFIISEKALNSNVHLIRYTSCPSHHIQKTHRALPNRQHIFPESFIHRTFRSDCKWHLTNTQIHIFPECFIHQTPLPMLALSVHTMFNVGQKKTQILCGKGGTTSIFHCAIVVVDSTM